MTDTAPAFGVAHPTVVPAARRGDTASESADDPQTPPKDDA